MNDEELKKLEEEINDLIEKTSGERPSMGTVECVLRQKDLSKANVKGYCEGCSSQLSCRKRVAIYQILALASKKSYETESIEEHLKKSGWITSTIQKVLTAKSVEGVEEAENK